jgi:hypothetical protein
MEQALGGLSPPSKTGNPQRDMDVGSNRVSSTDDNYLILKMTYMILL